MKFKKIAAVVSAAVVALTAPVTGVLSDPLGVTARAEEILSDGDWGYVENSDEETVTIKKYDGDNRNLTIPATLGGKTVTTIGDGTISVFSINSLESVVIPEGVTSLGEIAFIDQTDLTNVTLPASLKSIGGSAFQSNISLTNVIIPENVISIGLGAFYDCWKLQAINVDAKNKEYSSVNGVLFNKNQTELIQYPEGKEDISYSIPDGVTNIGSDAFSGSKLESITVPKSITRIGDYAFPNNISSSKIRFEGTQEQWEKVSKGENIPSNVTFAGIETTTFVNNTTQIEVTAEKGVFPENVTFNAELVNSQSGSFSYDLTFTDALGNDVQPNGNVTVSLPLPAGWTNAYVYHVEGDNKTLLPSNIKDGFIVFTTNHFSVYMISATEIKTSSGSSSSPSNSDSYSSSSSSSGTSSTAPTTTSNPPTRVAGTAALPVALISAALLIATKKRK